MKVEHRGAKILLAITDPTLRATLAYTLFIEGDHDVTAVGSGAGARRKIAEVAASEIYSPIIVEVGPNDTAEMLNALLDAKTTFMGRSILFAVITIVGKSQRENEARESAGDLARSVGAIPIDQVEFAEQMHEQGFLRMPQLHTPA